jgi:hypothetical protein
LAVQASGQISVRALVRGTDSAQGLAHSRPGGALKGYVTCCCAGAS